MKHGEAPKLPPKEACVADIRNSDKTELLILGLKKQRDLLLDLTINLDGGIVVSNKTVCHTLISFTCPYYSLQPLQVSLGTVSLVYLSLGFLSLCASSSCMFQINHSVFPVLLPFLFSFTSPPGFDPCLFSGLCTRLPDHSSCSDRESASHTVPPGLDVTTKGSRLSWSESVS